MWLGEREYIAADMGRQSSAEFVGLKLTLTSMKIRPRQRMKQQEDARPSMMENLCPRLYHALPSSSQDIAGSLVRFSELKKNRKCVIDHVSEERGPGERRSTAASFALSFDVN